ncbi:MAG: metallophosphoesterase [Thermoleophilaceae bacterium]
MAGLVLALACAAPAAAYTPEAPWPPAQGPGALYAHYGEEHWNDEDGLTLLPKVVADVVRYRPAVVTMSGDKANDGNAEELERWREIMRAYDEAGVPYFAAVGNHDREAPLGLPGGVSPVADLSNYVEVFAGRPYPFGDAAPYDDPALSPKERPVDDPEGAASHYFVDHGNVRWIFIDNSCQSITNCDPLQAPSAQNAAGRPQYEFLERAAGEAERDGRLAFVVMHQPTRDPRDPTYADPISLNHVMGKGISPDNQLFEIVAERAGVDAVFLGHIKGQFLYRGLGGIPYYIDGGAGGELYTTGPVGTDHGYWHGYRLLRVDGDRVETDTVPIVVEDGISIEGPDRVRRGERLHLEAFARQPVFHDPAQVPALELRDPDPRRPALLGSGLRDAGRWLLMPALLLLLLGLAARADLLSRGGLAPLALVVGLVAVSGYGAVSLAQSSQPTLTAKEALPTPARIWTSGNPLVLAPVAAEEDDPRRDTASQTDSGVFEASCPGRATVEITSGWEAQRTRITALSHNGRIVRSFRRGARSLRAGRARRVASVRLAQPAEVLVRVRRRGRTVATLAHECADGTLHAGWDGTRRGRRVRAGIYTVEVRVRSDRPTTIRRYRVRVR